VHDPCGCSATEKLAGGRLKLGQAVPEITGLSAVNNRDKGGRKKNKAYLLNEGSVQLGHLMVKLMKLPPMSLHSSASPQSAIRKPNWYCKKYTISFVRKQEDFDVTRATAIFRGLSFQGHRMMVEAQDSYFWLHAYWMVWQGL
jgi:hypothetical protein